MPKTDSTKPENGHVRSGFEQEAQKRRYKDSLSQPVFGVDPIISKIIQDFSIRLNVDPHFLIITENKLRLALAERVKNMEKRRSWIAPLGIFLALLLTLLTANFKDLYFRSSTWQAVFIIGAFISFLWLVFAIFQSCKSKSPEDLLDELMQGHKFTLREFTTKDSLWPVLQRLASLCAEEQNNSQKNRQSSNSEKLLRRKSEINAK